MRVVRSSLSPGFRRLAILCGAIALIWGIMLPRFARWPPVSARLAELEAQGIDPSAMYYSELGAMDDVLARIDRVRRRAPKALWSRAPASQTKSTD